LAADDVALTLAANAVVAGEFVAGGVLGFVWPCWSGTIQRPVCVHLWPQTIVRPGYTIKHLILVKVTIQAALHIATTDRRECNARPGMM
jgi:hypothetical protein